MKLTFPTGGEVKVPVARLEGLFQFFSKRCESFRGLMNAVLDSFQQLHLIVYNDELTPGDPLQPDNLRKSSIWYVTVLEFNQQLRLEDAWLPAALVRHVHITKLSDKMAEFSKCVFDVWCSPASVGLLTHGLVLDLGGDQRRVVKFKIISTLADYAALQGMWSAKGASGIRPCLKCQNVVAKTSDLDKHANDDGYLVTIACCDASKFDELNDDGCYAVASALKHTALHSSKSELDKLETAAGFNFHPSGLLQAEHLRLYVQPSLAQIDGMHTLYSSGGILNVEMGLFCDAVRQRAKVTLPEIQDFITTGWTAPSAYRFDDSNDRKSTVLNEKKLAIDHYRGRASELLYLIPLMHHFADTFKPQLHMISKEVDSFTASCNVSREYLRLKNTRSATLDVAPLHEAVERHGILFQQAHGIPYTKPKHHLTHHLADGIEAAELVVDCFPPERKGRTFTTLVNTRFKTLRNFENSVMARLLNIQCRNLQSRPDIFEDHLVKPIYDGVELALALQKDNVQISRRMRVQGMFISVNDMLVAKNTSCACKVLCCVRADRSFQVLVQEYMFQRASGPSCWWLATSNIAAISVSETCMASQHECFIFCLVCAYRECRPKRAYYFLRLS